MNSRYKKTFATGWSALEKRLMPSHVWTSDPLTFWRERILFLICFIAAVLGPIALVPSLLLAYKEGLWSIILIDSLAYMTIVIILVARNSSFVVRALGCCSILYALGICILFILGPVGAGYIWLFGASVLISTFIGFGAAIWTLAVNTIALLSVGIFIAYGNPAWILNVDNALEKWLVMSANFLILNALITITTAFLLNGLKTALLIEQKISKNLRESEELFRSYLEYAPDGVYMSDLEGNFLYGNRKCEEIIGYRREELIGKNFLELNILLEKSLNKAAQLLQANIEGKPTGPDEIELISKEGHLIPVEINTNVVQRSGQRIVIASVRDITERKKAEKNLQAALVKAHEGEARAAAIMASMGEGLSIQDTDFMILYQNQILKDLRGDHVGEHCYTAYENNDHVCEGCPVAMAYRDGGIHKAQRSVTTGKETIHVEITASPLRDIDGNIVAGIEVIRDVNDQKKLEAQLRHSQKMEAVGTLTGGIAHDFNNILNVIMGYGTMVKDALDAGSPAMEDMNEVLTAADRAADLTKRLLVFSRKKIAEVTSVNINALILGLKKLLGRIISESIEFNLDLADRPLMVLADAGEIEQVLINLAANARDAMPDGGRLTIGTGIEEMDEASVVACGYGKPGRYAQITVADTGQGMDAETQKKIFEPFFTTKGIGEGTGLGLAISYGIIKQHDGYINVYSEPGQGTVFTIYLPLNKGAASPDKKPEAAALKGGNETILIAEDEAALRKLTRTVLESFGYSVITAEDGEDAITKFMENKERISLVLLDMIMPKKSGKEVRDAIIKVAPRMKVLFASGYAVDKITNKELRESDFDFIHKPFRPKDLLIKVREFLDR